MSKLKTHKGAAKRFKITGSGKVKRCKAYRSHLMNHKSQKQKRKLRKEGIMFEGEAIRIRKLLPYS
ncbi:MAG: 50S ribosomal protein L35 [Firmicutes bacterium]|nr:50S ribosomal protein L35 [Bacillota bacterium]MDD4694741.1 50S ribosomal protein L35 [Bacillota bacterium]